MVLIGCASTFMINEDLRRLNMSKKDSKILPGSDYHKLKDDDFENK